MNDLRPVSTASKCASQKIKSTGLKTKKRLACFAIAAKKGVGVDPECLGKVAVFFANKFAKIESTQNDCLTTGDEVSIEDNVDMSADEIVQHIMGMVPTPTATATFTPTATPTAADTSTATATATATPTDTSTPTFTSTPTATDTPTPVMCGGTYPACNGTCNRGTCTNVGAACFCL